VHEQHRKRTQPLVLLATKAARYVKTSVPKVAQTTPENIFKKVAIGC
jgi:hypothetical protein